MLPAPNTKNILKFWRDIEFFLPFSLDEVYDKYGSFYEIFKNKEVLLPWQDLERYDLDAGKEWAFDVFIAPFLLPDVIDALKEIVPEVANEELPDPKSFDGKSCFLRLSVGTTGRILGGDTAIATLPWAIARFKNGGKLSMSEFEAFSDSVLHSLGKVHEIGNGDEEEEGEGEVLVFSKLLEVAETLSAGHPLRMCPNDQIAVVIPYSIRKKKKKAEENSEEELKTTYREASSTKETLKKKRKVDILNSFYLRDIERVNTYVNESKQAPSALQEFLCEVDTKPERIDVFSDSSKRPVTDFLSLEYLPKGRWPSKPGFILSSNQQLAINHYLNSDRKLHAVNGPPGTGKTTLIRDLLAELVVRRASVLSKLQKPADALSSSWSTVHIGRKECSYRQLKPALCGYELVVGSTNNSAVENISLELPRFDALANEFSDLTYLKQLGALYALLRDEEENAEDAHEKVSHIWGFPSVPLGNSKNRKLFRRAGFLYSSEEEKPVKEKRLADNQLLTLFEWRKQPTNGAVSFHQAKKDFRDAEELLKKLLGATEKNCELPEGLSLHSKDWQLKAPHVTAEINAVRSFLFVKALKLQEAWVREVPEFQREFMALSCLIGNPSVVAPLEGTPIWQLLFMIVPVISTTLASVERMFGSLSSGGLGNVVIDEAGQATPQAVAGILMRTKKALIIGDQRQLEPVVITPVALERQLSSDLDPDIRRHFSPLTSSAQSIADARNQYGTYLTDTGAEKLWVGTPLCVHRRCADPMFSLSNCISYDGIMIQANERDPSHEILGESCWFQTKGSAISKQWVREQGQVALSLVTKLIAAENELPDVFFITPFREVRAKLKSYLNAGLKEAGIHKEISKALMQRIGTVHTFQGKEADIVVFVLGCDFSTQGGANWAGERPNLVNVAVTRARDLLYVIGDVNLWHNRGFFSDLEKALPKKVWGSSD